MHLRLICKPPRLKQLPWSNRPSIEYVYCSSTVHFTAELVRKLVRCHARAIRFLLTMFEVLRRRVSVVMVVAVLAETDRSCSGNGAALMARITIDLQWFHWNIEWPTKFCEDCEYCGDGAIIMFMFQLNNIRDKCWGLVDCNILRGKL